MWCKTLGSSQFCLFSDWTDEAVSSHNILKLIYHGRFLHGNVSLGGECTKQFEPTSPNYFADEGNVCHKTMPQQFLESGNTWYVPREAKIFGYSLRLTS